MTRTFVAIDLGDEARAHLQREVARLSRALPGVRWVDPASLHLTLAFLGELTDERLATLQVAAREAAQGSRPFRLTVAGLGTFGPPLAPRVIWAGVSGDMRHLLRLQDALATALASCGFARDARPFAPHLTLARLHTALSPDQAQRLASLVEGRARSARRSATIVVESINVMKSELLRPAARYTRLQVIPLLGDTTPDA
jgi:RNA 2',3'-cyclic 3'-phosphodiesterase